jgi:hypothetical protein
MNTYSRYIDKLFRYLLGFMAFLLLNVAEAQMKDLNYDIELGGAFVGNRQTPFWLRINQSGTVPDCGFFEYPVLPKIRFNCNGLCRSFYKLRIKSFVCLSSASAMAGLLDQNFGRFGQGQLFPASIGGFVSLKKTW